MPVKRLSAHEREDIFLHKAAGLNNGEIGAMYKVSEGAIRYVLNNYKPGQTATRHGGGNDTKMTPRYACYFAVKVT